MVIDGSGTLVTSYAKVHLFNVDVPNGPVLMESRFTAPGNRLVSADSPAGRVGLTVCYDLRFPEVYQTLAHEHGATIMTVPSAFTKPTGARSSSGSSALAWGCSAEAGTARRADHQELIHAASVSCSENDFTVHALENFLELFARGYTDPYTSCERCTRKGPHCSPTTLY